MLVALVANLALVDAACADLQWQRGRAPKEQKSQAADRSTRSKSKRHHDGAVRTVGFEEDGGHGPRLVSGEEGRVADRSVIVDYNDQSNNVRAAQRSGAGESALPSSAQPTTPDSSLEEKLEAPFGDLRDQPPLQVPDIETPALPSDEDYRVQPDDTRRQPGEGVPPTYRPIPPPDGGTGPRTDANQELRQQIIPDITASDPMPGQTQESCEKSWANLKAKTIGTVDLNIAVTGKEGQDFPYECAVDPSEIFGGRCWNQTTYLWKASALCHKPLYFEDEQLERYGHSWPPCVQPFVSGAHFFCTLPVLPYCMGVEPPTECIYALGHYRPGNCAPYMCDPVPLSFRGAVFEAAAVTGAVFVIP